jgi:DNA end-binding protein Ku
MGSPTINFGLVNIACKQYKTTAKHGIEFHQHHGGAHGCGGNVGYRNYCKDCGQSVEYADITKGTVVDEKTGQVVMVTDDDFAAIERELGKSVEVVRLVTLADVDPMLYNGQSYWLIPDEPAKGKKGGTPGALRSYTLFVNELKKTRRAAEVRFTSGGTQRPAILRVMRSGKQNILVLQPLLWPDELRAAAFPILDKQVELTDQETDMAAQIMKGMFGKFDHSAYDDPYLERLQEVVADKAAGGQGIIPGEGIDLDTGTADVSDLLAKLAASVRKTTDTADQAAADEAAREASVRNHPAGKKTPIAKAV